MGKWWEYVTNAARYDLKTVKIQSPEGKIESVANAAMAVID